MHPDYEYDKDLHELALAIAKDDGHIGHNDGMILAEAYLDLLERRGMPPVLICHPSIQLQSGAYFNFVNPLSTPICPEDIAAGLSKASRYGGHNAGIEPYTVAQHCCHASDMAPEHLKFEALMHDAPESVLTDMMTPLKQLLPDYKQLEKRVSEAFATQFGVPFPETREVKEIDTRMLATEHRDIMPPGEWPILEGIEPYWWKITIWDHEEAREQWLRRFYSLWDGPNEH